jgi:hypothetical protein
VRHSLRITVLLLAAGLVVLAAGCGGSNSSAPPTTGVTSTQQDTTTNGTGGTGNFASSHNCLQFAGLAGKIASAMAPTSGGDTQSAIQAETRELQALADAAPSDIKGDFQTFATAFSSYIQAIQNSGYKLGSTTPPTAAQIAALATAAKALSTTKMTQAEQHLQAWARANCN